MPDIAGILLAAGRGVRFGGNKLLYPLADGTPMGVAAARALLAAVPDSIAVVHPENVELVHILEREGVRIVVCAQSGRGMGASISCGVRATHAVSGWVIALADMPFVQPATVRCVVAALAGGATLVAPVYREQRGHPVGLAASYREELLRLDGDDGARAIVSRDDARLHRIVVDDRGAVIDVDRVADLGGGTG